MMALTVNASMAGAMKATLESVGLGLAVYRDGAPRDRAGAIAAPYPHVVVQEGIAFADELHGDDEGDDAHDGVVELVQVDLYQVARSQPDAAGRTTVLESYTLPGDLAKHLRRRGTLAERAPWQVYGLSIDSGQRWPVSDNIVRHTWTVRVRRDAERKAETP